LQLLLVELVQVLLVEDGQIRLALVLRRHLLLWLLDSLTRLLGLLAPAALRLPNGRTASLALLPGHRHLGRLLLHADELAVGGGFGRGRSHNLLFNIFLFQLRLLELLLLLLL
jgi:hypothetical protein